MPSEHRRRHRALRGGYVAAVDVDRSIALTDLKLHQGDARENLRIALAGAGRP
jgi:hypothetical protein